MGDFDVPVKENAISYAGLKEHEIFLKLEECREELAVKGVGELENCFPILSFIIRRFSDLNVPIRELCFNICLQELRAHSSKLANLDLFKLDQNDKLTLQNVTKILCYLVVSLAIEFENESIHINKEKKGKKLNEATHHPFWNERRSLLMKMVVDLCKLDLFQIWEPPSAAMMEDLSTLLTSLCYKCLENSAIVRDKVLLDLIADLLGLAVQKYGLSLSVGIKLLQLLQHFDHLINPISFIVVAMVTNYSSKQVVLDIFREISSMDPSDLAMDTSGTKCFADFIVTVTGQIPSVILPAVPSLLPHLSGESTTFRNGVLSVLGELLRELSASSDEGMLADARDKMLEKLVDHLHDTNAFVRVKVLHIFLQLCSVQVIPLPFLQMILENAAGRLKDKSSLVRKCALQLLCSMLSNNPYAAKLDKSELDRKLREEEISIANDDADPSGVMDYLKSTLNFISSITECISMAVEMLRSKVVSDVLESLEFLCVAKLFQVDGAEEGIKKSLPLVWSRDEQLRSAVVSVYVHLYLTPGSSSDKTTKEHSKRVVKNLFQIMTTATSGELASLEKLVGVLVDKGHIPSLAIEEFWAIYGLGNPTRKDDSILACQLLSMIIPVDPAGCNILSCLDRLISNGLTQSDDLLMAKHTCCAINSLIQGVQAVRLPNSHNLFRCLYFILNSNLQNSRTSHWIPLCEQAVNMIYHLSEHPNYLSEDLLKSLSHMIFKPQDEMNSVFLARLLFCAGHIAQCQVLHCELNIVNERKKMMKELQKAGGGGVEDKGELEEELGLVGGSEEQVTELVHKVMETEVGGPGGMLSLFEPLIISVVSNPSKFPCDKLQTSATLALSKFMLVSPGQCEKYLQLFFTVMEKSPLSTIRANLIIAASDLVCRFPNTIEPWTPFLYSRLKDDSDLVRKNTMMVLTHLILNDMVKIRGQISSMALCLEDTDPIIVELAQVFFYELSQKGNTLYNVLPDIISQLSVCIVCTPTSFKNVIKYMFQFIKKEKHQESLIEKLCHRLRAIRVELQAQNIAYCLSLFMPSEKGFLKLLENFACFQDKLTDEVIFMHLISLVNKAKKPEIKVLAEELNKKMCDVIGKSECEAGPIADGGSDTCTTPKKKTNHNYFQEDVLSAARKQL